MTRPQRAAAGAEPAPNPVPGTSAELELTMSNRLDFEFGLGTAPAGKPRPRQDHEPMRILLMGDLSGRSSRGEPAEQALSERTVRAVDIDNLEQQFARLAPALALPLTAAQATRVEIRSLDEVHPDELYGRIEVFEELRRTRAQLADPATYRETAAALKSWAEQGPSESAAEPGPGEGEEASLERLLGKPRSPDTETAATQSARGAVGRLVQDIVAPYITPGTDPEQSMLLSSVDDAISGKMREILHQPEFQGLEAAWRSVQWLVSSLGGEEQVRLYLLDLTREELVADVGGHLEQLDRTGLYRLLVQRGVGTPGGEPWSVLVGNFPFGHDPEDIALLAGLGAIASRAGGPFLAAAHAEVVGSCSLAEAAEPRDWQIDPAGAERWQRLRASWTAPWLGLALPRVLLRLPYGAATDPLEAFDFEELPTASPHSGYLWGNPGFACALLLALSHVEGGTPGDNLEIGDLPAHVYDGPDGRTMKPCAEAWLTERAAHQPTAC